MNVIERYKKDLKEMTWSYSRANAECMFCWVMNYIVKNYGEKDGNAFSEYGLGLHELMEDYLSGDVLKFQLEKKFKDHFKSNVREFPPNKWTDLNEDYYKDGLDFVRNGLKFLDKYDIIGIEQEVDTEIDGYKFTGYIDLILQDKNTGGYVIFDWKSKKKYKSLKEQKEYARQLYLYSKYVIENLGETPEKLIFYHFRTQKQTVIDFDVEEYNEAIQWFLDRIEHFNNLREFKVTDNYFFRNHLCNYRQMQEHKEGEVLSLEEVYNMKDYINKE